ncbi:hypothetical protein [Streptococcus merionis]|uniref:hypothetical protein n=1 Tax=Streptococcus merionis TaxID=400065 RepID=UPI0026EBBEF9|nr:hypothetical protein [Streptococcus merionis]
MKKGWRKLYYPFIYLDLATVSFLSLFFYWGRNSFQVVTGLFLINSVMTILQLLSIKKELHIRRILGMAYMDVVYAYQGYHGASLFLGYLIWTIVSSLYISDLIRPALLLLVVVTNLFLGNTILVNASIRRML